MALREIHNVTLKGALEHTTIVVESKTRGKATKSWTALNYIPGGGSDGGGGNRSSSGGGDDGDGNGDGVGEEGVGEGAVGKGKKDKREGGEGGSSSSGSSSSSSSSSNGGSTMRKAANRIPRTVLVVVVVVVVVVVSDVPLDRQIVWRGIEKDLERRDVDESLRRSAFGRVNGREDVEKSSNEVAD
ncbi:hypothetical protein V1478_004160 [Vespula squamosa]|uniref:Uncharacterized protein n=1 Tax=Vespula squamosa TaxID=30214 RepID=A0ABD2BNV4_VESSQ